LKITVVAFFKFAQLGARLRAARKTASLRTLFGIASGDVAAALSFSTAC
jgi:hypothetical protein